MISDYSHLCPLFPLPPATVKDYDAFFEARENNAVYAFLGLTAPPGSKVGGHLLTLSLWLSPPPPLLRIGSEICAVIVPINLPGRYSVSRGSQASVSKE